MLTAYRQSLRVSPRRALVALIALSLALAGATFEDEPFFGLSIPLSVPNVPSEILNPKNMWPDKAAYDVQAKKLAELFAKNFLRFEAQASPGVKAAAIKPHS